MNISNISLYLLWIIIYINLFILIFKSNLSIIQTILSLIFFTISATLIISNYSTWSIYSFLIFLIIIGGLIILFILFIRLISNQYQYSLSWKNLFIFIIYTILFFALKLIDFRFNFNFLDQYYLENYFDLSFKNKKFYAWINVNKLLNYSSNLFIIILIIFLLIILFSITKICLSNIKPLRSSKK